MVSRQQLLGFFGQRVFGLLTQAGTAIPTANVKNQSLNKAFTWGRTGVGTYTLTGPAGSFPADTIIRAGVYDQATGKCLTGVRSSDTVLTFKHGVAGGAASDVFTNVPFEVIVFG